MMNILEENYWAMYFDFIDMFEEITYKEIPLALLSTGIYMIYKDKFFKGILKQEDLKKKLKNNTLSKNQIQKKFERHRFNENLQIESKDQKHNKILIYPHALYFTNEMFNKYFDTNNTIFITEKNSKNSDFQTYSLDNFQSNTIKAAQQLIKRVEKIFSTITNHPIFSQPNFQQKFISDIPHIVSKIEMSVNFFNQVPVSCLVVGETSNMWARILTLVAAKKKIPSICIQLGLMLDEKHAMPVLVTKQTVYGEYEKEVFKQYGVSEECLEITGHPRFDKIFTDIFISSSEFIQKLKLNQQTKKIMIAANDAVETTYWNDVIDLLQREPSFEIILKPHHREVKFGLLKEYYAASSKCPSVKIAENWNTNDLLKNVDIVLVETSTVGLEATLFGKPVVFFHKDNTYHDYYKKMEYFVKQQPLDVVNIVKQLLTEPTILKSYETKRKEFLEFNYPQKNSGRKIVELINKFYKGEKLVIWRKPNAFVMSDGKSVDSFIGLEGGREAFKLGMQPGETYKMSADIYVPAITGLNPEFGRGLKIVAFWKVGDKYYEKHSNAPTSIDTWQPISVTFTIPVNATEAFIRLYLGFKELRKFVCYDNLQLEKV